MSDGDPVHVSHRVPAADRDAAQENTRRGEISEAVRSVYRAFATGESYPGHAVHAAERRVLERVEERIEDQQADLGAVLDDVSQRRAELDAEREERTASRDDYEDRLCDLEERLERGFRVFAEQGIVRDAASCCGRPPSQVIEELRQRNPEIPEHAFKSGTETTKEWDGVQS